MDKLGRPSEDSVKCSKILFHVSWIGAVLSAGTTAIIAVAASTSATVGPAIVTGAFGVSTTVSCCYKNSIDNKNAISQ